MLIFFLPPAVQQFLSIVAINIFKYRVEEAGSESREKGYFTLTRVQNFTRILNNRKKVVILMLIFFLPPPAVP